jgi:DNA-binding MarR family transcriptional regulator
MLVEPTRGDVMSEILDGLTTWLLSRSAARAHRLLSQGLEAEGYTGYEFRVIAAISAMGVMSQAEIGRGVALDRRDVTDTVRQLEQRELIVRRSDPKNGRALLVELTARGRNESDRLKVVMNTIQRQVLAPLSESEAKQLVTLLGKMTGTSGAEV